MFVYIYLCSYLFCLFNYVKIYSWETKLLWLVYWLSLCWGYRSFHFRTSILQWLEEDSGILPETSRFRGFWEAKTVNFLVLSRRNHLKPVGFFMIFHLGSTAVTHHVFWCSVEWARPMKTRMVAETQTCPQTGIVFMGKQPQPGEEDQRCLLAQLQLFDISCWASL